MAASEHPIIEIRHDQMFPVLEPAEIDLPRPRLRDIPLDNFEV